MTEGAKVSLYGYDTAVWRPVLVDASGRLIIVTAAGVGIDTHLYGYNGATWDRLRSYPTGILKVGRAEVGLLDVRMIAVGQVGAAGARKLYWLACNPSAGNSVWEITDDTDGSTAIRLDCFSTAREAKGFVFDPPMEFTNGIYLKTFTNMTSCIFGYL